MGWRRSGSFGPHGVLEGASLQLKRSKFCDSLPRSASDQRIRRPANPEPIEIITAPPLHQEHFSNLQERGAVFSQARLGLLFHRKTSPDALDWTTWTTPSKLEGQKRKRSCAFG